MKKLKHLKKYTDQELFNEIKRRDKIRENTLTIVINKGTIEIQEKTNELKKC